MAEKNDIGQIIKLSPEDFEVVHDSTFEEMVVKETNYEEKEDLDTPEEWRKELYSKSFIKEFDEYLNAYYEDGWWWFKGNPWQDQCEKQVFIMEYESESTGEERIYDLNFKIRDEIWAKMK